MNWTLALPEIVLAVVGMATLVFGVLRKQQDTHAAVHHVHHWRISDHRSAGADADDRVRLQRPVVADPFSAFNQILILIGAALCSILALDWNRSQGIARFEFPVLVLFATVGMMIMASAAT